ncbi:MAG TPA: GNAT family N-acetyltransferase [Galbitalea sp.]|jgi:ribosomal protein S18 acetylase RimI-like enzyme|nr:GNAT family N-acetyltransferase [Galbitalea sp.]
MSQIHWDPEPFSGEIPAQPVLEIRRAGTEDAAALHALAVATFGLACPRGTAQESIDDFLATTLSETSFASYLVDPNRALFLAVVDDHPAGYTMVNFGEPADPDVLSAITLHPTSELSKVYVLEGHHGSGVAGALVDASIAAASDRAAAGIWLGVNQENARANRFYEKQGFALVGTKRFLLGGNWEDDFVRERTL